jgi:ketosteroid isomerase-like protein
MITLLVFVSLLLGVFGGCASPPATPAFDLAGVQVTIEAANTRYDERFQTDSLAFYEERYLDSACLMPENIARICGLHEIAGYYFNGGMNRDFRLDILVTELSGGPEGVIEEGTYATLDAAGTTLDRGKFIALWRQDVDGRWKLYREIWNSDLPRSSG